MPLTKEQFESARKAGFSVEKIINFEKRRQAEQPDFSSFNPVTYEGAPDFVGGLSQASQPQSFNPFKAAFTPVSQQFGGPSIEQVLIERFPIKAEESGRPLNMLRRFGTSMAGGIADIAQTPGSYIPLPIGKLLGKIPVKGTTLERVATTTPVGKGFFGGVKELGRYDQALKGMSPFSARAPQMIPMTQRLQGFGQTITGKELLGDKGTPIARGSIKSLIGTKEPAVAESIAKEKFVANNIRDLKSQMKSRTDELMNVLNTAYDTETKRGKLINLGRDKTLGPLFFLKEELLKNPKTNQAAIHRVQNFLDDLIGLSKGEMKKFNKMTPNEAHAFKQQIGELITWNRSSVDIPISSQKTINKALKQVYGYIDNSIDQAVPDTKILNFRVSKLIDANRSIEKKISGEKSLLDKMNFYGITSLPFEPLRATALRTRLSSGLVKGYPKIEKFRRFGGIGTSKGFGKEPLSEVFPGASPILAKEARENELVAIKDMISKLPEKKSKFSEPIKKQFISKPSSPKNKPSIPEQFTKGDDPLLLDYLSLYLPPKYAASLSTAERLKLGNMPATDLRDLYQSYFKYLGAGSSQRHIELGFPQVRFSNPLLRR